MEKSDTIMKKTRQEMSENRYPGNERTSSPVAKLWFLLQYGYA